MRSRPRHRMEEISKREHRQPWDWHKANAPENFRRSARATSDPQPWRSKGRHRAEIDHNVMATAVVVQVDDAIGPLNAVHGQARHATALALGVAHLDAVLGGAVTVAELEAGPRGRDAGIEPEHLPLAAQA